MSGLPLASRVLAVGLALFSGAALAQQGVVPTQPIPQPAPVTPPLAPTAPGQQPEPFGRFLERGSVVTQRPRPEYDPLGLRFGNWFFYPKIELDEVYNDNIFATKSNRKNDFITVVSPTLDLRSRVPDVYDVDVTAGANVGTHARFSNEDYGDYFAGADGTYNIERNLLLLGGLRFEHLHEERDSPDQVGTTTNPAEFNATTATAGIASRGLRIGWQFDVGYQRQDWDNEPAIGGGVVQESQRNLNIYTANATGTYEIAPRYQAFTRFGYNVRDYDNSGAINRNSNGWRFDVGGRVDITGVTFAELRLGYLAQDYSSAQLKTIDGVDAGAKVVWSPTQLTSLTFNADRSVQDSNTFALAAAGSTTTSPGYLRSNIGVGIDHELLRNVLLNGFANYQIDDYAGIDRTDNRVDIGAGVRYMFTRNLYLGGSYTFSHRDSNGTASGVDFERNLFLIRLGAQL
jgi:hypothetical protein